MKYCSLGDNCTSSNVLKRTELKTESYPFDWIFSNVNVVTHSIQDGFTTFLNKEEYVSVKHDSSNSWLLDGERACGHNVFNKHNHGVTFRHHDPAVFEADYAYFERCVQRFKNLLTSDEDKVFFKTYLNKTSDDEAASLSESIMLSELLSKHTTNYKLIVIYACPIGTQGYEVKYNDNNLIFCNLYTVTESTGVDFADITENLYLDSVFIDLLKLITLDS